MQLDSAWLFYAKLMAISDVLSLLLMPHTFSRLQMSHMPSCSSRADTSIAVRHSAAAKMATAHTFEPHSQSSKYMGCGSIEEAQHMEEDQ